MSHLGYLWFLGLAGFLSPIYQPLQWFHLFFLFAIFWTFGLFRLLLLGLGVVVADLFSRHRPDLLEGELKPAEVKAMARFAWLQWLAGNLNPFGLSQGLAHIVGQLVAYLRTRGRLPAPETYHQHTMFTLPFEGTWTVGNGGTDEATSHSWDILNQLYAYDFIVMDATGKTYRDDGRRPEHYYAFGQPILAPADGRVVQARDGVRDYPSPHPVSGSIDWRTRDFRGNFVVIEHTRGEYSFLAHLQEGSICVRPGDTVHQGQKIGLCGNSGHSTEPHLHFHVQDHPDVFLAVSLPVRFSNFRLMNDPSSEVHSNAYLTRNQQVASSTASTE